MNRTDTRGFRVFLRLRRMQARQEALAALPDEPEGGGVPEPLAEMAQGLDKARQALTRRDWLGYETELFRLAAQAFRSLEAHQLRLGCGSFHARTRWRWESLAHPGTSGSWPNRAQAIAQAEAELAPGEAYRVGRLAASPPHRYVPKTEGLLSQMRDRARLEHGEPDLDWPQLDLRQHQELQGFLEGLLVAYLEAEGLNLTLTQWVDEEVHRVPEAGSAARVGP